MRGDWRSSQRFVSGGTRRAPSCSPSICWSWTALICGESLSRRARRPSPALLRKGKPGVRLNEHIAHPNGAAVFHHACKMGLEGIVSKRLGSVYRSGRTSDWLKFKNPEAPAARREAEEDWSR